MDKILCKWHHFFNVQRSENLNDLGLLILRVGIGLLMAFSHGFGKMQKYFSGAPIQFADPIGLGQETSLLLAGSAEFFCALALAFGLFTRIVSIPLLITMAVAVFIIHAGDPFNKQEFPLLYLLVFMTFILCGGGRYSLDALLKKRFS